MGLSVTTHLKPGELKFPWPFNALLCPLHQGLSHDYFKMSLAPSSSSFQQTGQSLKNTCSEERRSEQRHLKEIPTPVALKKTEPDYSQGNRSVPGHRLVRQRSQFNPVLRAECGRESHAEVISGKEQKSGAEKKADALR